MATWEELAAAEPAIASAGWAMLSWGLAYLGTVRFDGSPLVQPVVPILSGGELSFAIDRDTATLSELQRNPRVALQALPGENDDEFSIYGTAREDWDAAVFGRAHASDIPRLNESETLISIDIDTCAWTRWVRQGEPDMYRYTQTWQSARRRRLGFVGRLVDA